MPGPEFKPHQEEETRLTPKQTLEKFLAGEKVGSSRFLAAADRVTEIYLRNDRIVTQEGGEHADYVAEHTHMETVVRYAVLEETIRNRSLGVGVDAAEYIKSSRQFKEVIAAYKHEDTEEYDFPADGKVRESLPREYPHMEKTMEMRRDLHSMIAAKIAENGGN